MSSSNSPYYDSSLGGWVDPATGTVTGAQPTDSSGNGGTPAPATSPASTFTPAPGFVNTSPTANTGANNPALATVSASNPVSTQINPMTGIAFTQSQLEAMSPDPNSPNGKALAAMLAPAPGTPPPAPAGPTQATGTPSAAASDISGLAGNAQEQQLVDLLMGRAQQSLNIDPTTDPIIQPQVSDYGATQTRQARNLIDSTAEGNSPYATGANQYATTQAAETAGQNTANFQSTLVQNELTARRTEIQNALSESGSLLTGEQQLSLQQELGLINSSIAQQQVNSGNDQFAATLGLQTTNAQNYWNSQYSGLL